MKPELSSHREPYLNSSCATSSCLTFGKSHFPGTSISHMSNGFMSNPYLTGLTHKLHFFLWALIYIFLLFLIVTTKYCKSICLPSYILNSQEEGTICLCLYLQCLRCFSSQEFTFSMSFLNC